MISNSMNKRSEKNKTNVYVHNWISLFVLKDMTVIYLFIFYLFWCFKKAHLSHRKGLILVSLLPFLMPCPSAWMENFPKFFQFSYILLHQNPIFTINISGKKLSPSLIVWLRVKSVSLCNSKIVLVYLDWTKMEPRTILKSWSFAKTSKWTLASIFIQSWCIRKFSNYNALRLRITKCLFK